jgi:hypothetical protein
VQFHNSYILDFEEFLMNRFIFFYLHIWSSLILEPSKKRTAQNSNLITSNFDCQVKRTKFTESQKFREKIIFCNQNVFYTVIWDITIKRKL